jgi:3-oxoacyl-[acyl-carrier protein] reductase
MFSFKNKTAVITGSRRGIGKGIAEVLAHGGANIVISDISQKECDAAAAQISRKYMVDALGIKCDVSKAKEVEQLIQKAVSKFGRIDIIVNNAGVFASSQITKSTEADWSRMVDINLKGCFNCCKAAASQMIAQKYGRIINIASIAGIVGYANSSVYSATKGGIIAMTRELSLELAPFNINVNAIAPGAIDTPMTAFLKKNRAIYSQTLAGIPKKRLGSPADIGYAAAYLASDEADYVTGQTLVVDGGWTVH